MSPPAGKIFLNRLSFQNYFTKRIRLGKYANAWRHILLGYYGQNEVYEGRQMINAGSYNFDLLKLSQ